MKVTEQPNKIRLVSENEVCYTFAMRGQQGNQWYIYTRDRKDVFQTVARVSGKQPEARQRRMVMAILKEIDR